MTLTIATRGDKGNSYGDVHDYFLDKRVKR